MRTTIDDLERLLQQRLAAPPPDSYSVELFRNPELLQRKVMEEAFETCLELGRAEPDTERVASEAADLLYHLLVGLVLRGVTFDKVLEELERRR